MGIRLEVASCGLPATGYVKPLTGNFQAVTTDLVIVIVSFKSFRERIAADAHLQLRFDGFADLVQGGQQVGTGDFKSAGLWRILIILVGITSLFLCTEMHLYNY